MAVCREVGRTGWGWVLAVAAAERVPSAWPPVAGCFITQIATRLPLGEGSGGSKATRPVEEGRHRLWPPI